jgi:hypothetical protein
MKAFNSWLHVPQPKLQVIGRVIAMLHNASLLCVVLCFYPLLLVIPDRCRIDDIEDNSQLRRGRPGTSSAINSVTSSLILCYLFVKLRTKYMAFHRLSILPTMCTFWPFKKSLLSKRRDTGPMTFKTGYTPRTIWIRS